MAARRRSARRRQVDVRRTQTPGDIVDALQMMQVDDDVVDRISTRVGLDAEQSAAFRVQLRSGGYDYGRVLLDGLLTKAPEEVREFFLESPEVFAITSRYTRSMNACSFHA